MECKITDTRYKVTIFASITSSLNYANTRILFLLSENVYSETSEKYSYKVQRQIIEISDPPTITLSNSSLTLYIKAENVLIFTAKYFPLCE